MQKQAGGGAETHARVNCCIKTDFWQKIFFCLIVLHFLGCNSVNTVNFLFKKEETGHLHLPPQMEVTGYALYYIQVCVPGKRDAAERDGGDGSGVIL